MSSSDEPAIRLTIQSTPFAHDPEGADAFYAALGRLMFLWGRLETHFATSLLTIMALPGSEAIREQLPISWKRRAKVWRAAFNAIPQLEPGRDAALSLMTDIMNTAPNRHTVTHSAWKDFVSTNPLTATVATLREKNGMVEFRQYRISIDQLREMQLEADRLNARLVPISTWLTSLQPPRPRVPDKP